MPKGKVVHFYAMNAYKEKRVTTPFILKLGTTRVPSRPVHRTAI